MKKLLALILVVAAITCFLAVPAFAADKLIVKDSGGTNTVFVVQDTGNVQAQNTTNGIVSVRVNNPDIFGAAAAAAQEQIVLGPSGSEHLILQALSDSHATMPSTALLNAYTHNFFVRTNAQNVFKIFKTGAVADTLVLNSGKVGVGTASPTRLLSVGTGGAGSDGSVWFTSSSREYKDNIQELSADKAIETVNNMTPVTFVYKNIPGYNHVGFIAEDVPDLVATPDRKSLSSMDIVAVLTKVVQEQNKTIAELSDKLSKLEAQVARIKSREMFGSVDPMTSAK